MNKVKLFVDNFLIYGLGGIISKIIPLIMVPLIAKIMPSTSYLGISDMSQTIISFGCALAILGMYDAMYRLFFEKKNQNGFSELVIWNMLFIYLQLPHLSHLQIPLFPHLQECRINE